MAEDNNPKESTLKHSPFGSISLVIAMLFYASLIILVFIIAIFTWSALPTSAQDTINILGGTLPICAIIVGLIGLAKDQKKKLSALSLALTTPILFFICIGIWLNFGCSEHLPFRELPCVIKAYETTATSTLKPTMESANTPTATP